jgi:P4 family phage/plasmid primase-like protien
MYKSTKPLPLYNFLDNYRVKKGEPHTHTSMGAPLGSFNIPEELTDEFYTLYKKHVEAGNLAHIIEKHKEYSSILIDIDFRFKEDITDRQYTKQHIEGLVEIYHDAIKEVLILPNESTDLIAFVFQKSKPYLANKVIKDGIHIMYPFIVTEPAIQYLIRDIVLKKLKEVKLLEDIPSTNPLSDIVDKAVIYKNGWLMMKSSKPNCEAYAPTYIFDSCGEIDFAKVDYKGMSDNVGKFFSIRRYSEADSFKIKNDGLLIKYNTKKSSYKYNTSSFKTMGEKEYITSLVGILSSERYDNFEKWIEVGICLNSISQCDESFHIWDTFSQQSSKYEAEGTQVKWKEITESNKNRKEVTMGSLVYWAKTDNEKAYMALKRNDIRKKITQTLKSPTHWDIANVLYEMYKGQYIFADKMWYFYKDHRWTQDLDAFCLRSKISKELVGEYLIIMSENNEKSGELSDDEDDDAQNNDIMTMNKKIMAIVKDLKNSGFKDNVTKECKELFQDKNFVARLDMNEYLVGFDNGIYDLTRMEFRDGRPDDYLTFTTGTDYNVSYDEDPCIEDIENFMDQLISNEEVKEYMLLLLASMMQGINAEEKFRIWTGSGGNGKSKLLELFISSFGEYCIKFPITLLTGKRASSNSATPEVIQSKGKRFGYFDEPNENERINIGLMKEFSGNDKIKGRGLYQAPIEFKPQFKLVLLCNALPEVPPDDEGCWRRMEVVEFKNKFVETPVADNEYPRDYQLSAKLKEWKHVFLPWLINKYYSKYREMKSLSVPGEVVNFTQDYQKQMDIYTEFIDDNLIKDAVSKDTLSFTEIHKVFKDWYSDNYTTAPPNKKELTKQLQKKFKKPILTSTGLKGYLFKSAIIEEEEEEYVFD